MVTILWHDVCYRIVTAGSGKNYQIMKFKVLFPDGGLINQDTVIKGANNSYKIHTEVGICKVIKAQWCKWTKSKNFTEWAKELNEDGNFEGEFSKEDALDHLCSNFHLELNGKAINLRNFFDIHMPLRP